MRGHFCVALYTGRAWDSLAAEGSATKSSSPQPETRGLSDRLPVRALPAAVTS